MKTLAVAITWLAIVGAARADSGALFGESARAVALADAVVARPGDTSALWWNPGGLADVTRPTLAVLGHAGFTRTRFARHGELGETIDEGVFGYGLSVVAPLPGPWWLRRVRLGGAVHIPGDAVIHVRVPVRDDTPRSPYYGGRTQRTAATFGVAAELPWTIRLGGAITVSPNLVAPTRVGFDASRGETVDEGVFVEQERVLSLDVSFLLGVRVQPIDELAFGLVWRQGGATRASGTFDIRAGAIRVADEYAFYELLAPEEVALGVAVWPVPGLSLSLDATWGRWSSYRTLHDAAPDPGFSDVVDVRLGAELALHRAVALRAGYGFLPSPVPAQTARDNLLDAHRHEVAFGVGVDLEAAARIPARIDLAFRFHARHRQEADKDLARVPDASEAPGHLVTNLGYPGFSSTGSFAQLSLAVTFLLDGAATESEPEPEPDAALRSRPGRDGELSLCLCVFARNCSFPVPRPPEGAAA